MPDEEDPRSRPEDTVEHSDAKKGNRSGKVAGAYRRLAVVKQAKDLEATTLALPTGRFQVIVADPRWQYTSRHSLPYPTMSIAHIKAVPILDIADDNAIVWLWTTNAHLRVASEVVETWGIGCVDVQSCTGHSCAGIRRREAPPGSERRVGALL